MLTTNRQVAPWFRQRYQPYRRVISDLYDDICDAKDRPGGTRRLRLLAVALMRRSGWRHPVIDLIGDLADRKVRTADVEAVVEAGVAAGKADTWCRQLLGDGHRSWVVANVLTAHFVERAIENGAEMSVPTGLVRCIVGDSGRTVAANGSWRSSAVLGIAEAIYEERAFDRLPILADALEEAGCDQEYLLAHCRGDDLHDRGCWVVDAVLGKSQSNRAPPALKIATQT
jgi:hypothetical protein